MIITDITPQKKNKNRVNIFIDGNFAFSLPVEALVKAGLHIDQNISQEKIEELIKASEYLKLYNKAVKFLSFRPRSEKEVVFYLKRKQAGEKEILMIINKLKDLDLINDSQFIKWWLEQRETFRPRSVRVIEMELLKKGVNRKIINAVLAEKEKNLDLKMSRKTAIKAYKRYQNLPKNEQRQKMSNFLLQRGFDWETVKTAIDEFLKKE